MINKIENVQNLKQSNDKFLILRRINFNGMRLYIQDEPFVYFSGLTGALDKSTFKGDPVDKRLQSWRESMIDTFGQKAQRDYVDMTAEFGTLVHEALVTIDKEGEIDWNEEKDKAAEVFYQYYVDKLIPPDTYVIRKMVYEYQKHVASMLQFVHERVTEIIAIETPAVWPELKIATPIDLICVARQTPKGDPIPCVINVKTSNQITDHHLTQVSLELAMWNRTYPNHQCQAAGILRTKDWREKSGPSYDYKYRTPEEAESQVQDKLKAMELCLKSDASYYPDPRYKKFVGKTKLGDSPEIVEVTIEQEYQESISEQATGEI